MQRIIIIFIFFFVFPSVSFAKEPSDTLKKYIDKTIEVFKTYDNPTNSTEYKLEFENKLIDLAKDIFAFDIMSRMVLGRHYRKLSKAQQRQFECLFIELLAQNYFDKILSHVEDIKKYPKNNIEIVDQIIFSSRKAEVKTKVKYQDKYIPVNYRFVFFKKKWKIYDVYVEGVSLIKNYRSQFKDMLLKKSPKEVIDELRAKLKDTKCSEKINTGCLKLRCLYIMCNKGTLYAH
ncbi:MlaC/ttg2D family ABC transporter substrate-binding protein [Desulfothermus sp.]